MAHANRAKWNEPGAYKIQLERMCGSDGCGFRGVFKLWSRPRLPCAKAEGSFSGRRLGSEMSFFRYQEPRYYFFGLKAGLRNLLQNGFALGAKRTLGKIAQPINWYTRFPEYYYFDRA